MKAKFDTKRYIALLYIWRRDFSRASISLINSIRVELSRWVVRKLRIFLIRNELPPLRRRYIYFVRGIINRSSVYLVIRGKNNA